MTGWYVAVRPRAGDPAGAEHLRTELRFAFRPPGTWWEDRGGRVTVGRTGRAPWDAPGWVFPTGRWAWDFEPRPARLVAPRLEGAGGDPGEWDGRAARVRGVEGPDGAPVEVWVDEELGLLLRAVSVGSGYLEELTELAFPAELPDQPFGPVTEEDDGRSAAELRRYEAVRAHYRDRPLPLPTAWPGGSAGLGRPAPIDGDPATGYLVLDLDPVPAPDLPTGAQLVRQPPGDEPYRAGWAAGPSTHLHRWRDGRWQWTFLLTGRPLTPVQVAAVADGLRDGPREG